MNKAEFKGLYLKLNTVKDSDIIKRLDDQENKQRYIKDLIRIDTSLDGLRHAYKGEENGQHNND